MPTSTAHVPPILHSVAGRILDVDSHESIPIGLWGEEFGDVTAPLADSLKHASLLSNSPIRSDETEINLGNVWNVKGPAAPGSISMVRRLEVLDYIGVHRQMLFPGTVGLAGSYLYGHSHDSTVLKSITGDRHAYARSLLTAHNDWCIRRSRISERVRPVAILVADSVDELFAKAKHLVASGIRVIMMMAGQPPGGHSPAHPALDPMWRFLSDANVPIVLHVGGEGSFLQTDAWRNAPVFDGFKAGDEFNLDPWTLSTVHLAAQNFTATMVLGGVFERHPKLRFGSIEVGAQWIGPLAENLDLWHANSRKFAQRGAAKILPSKPSEYIRRNVRVSAFDFEPIDKYIRDFGLEESYCYASDYPHHEGGRAPMADLGSRIANLGPRMIENFFVENATLLLPA